MKAKLNKGWYLLNFYFFINLMVSCLGSNNNESDYSITDAELIYFGLYHTDSLPELANVVFSIDQKGPVGLIYNYDSMAYLTELPEKVFIDFATASGLDNILNITDGDSIWVKKGDSIDISRPLTFKVYALDGKTTKLYSAQLNIHQVNPDSVQFHLIAPELPFLQTEDTKTIAFNNRFLTYSKIGDQIQLYSSQDAINWMQENTPGLPVKAVIRGIQSIGDRMFSYTDDGELYVRYDLSLDQWIKVNKPASVKIKSVLGYLHDGPKQAGGLCLIVETKGINTFAFTKDFIQWDYDSIAPVSIPDNFPLYDFSNHCFQLMLTGRITVFGGISQNGTVLNTVWSTENGRYWARLNTGVNNFPVLKGANIFYYNNEFWVLNGKTDEGFNKRLYYSKDGGVTWWLKLYTNIYNDELVPLPEEYTPRFNASLVTDKDNKYIYIIGGQQDDVLTDVWKGFLNKMEFEH